MKETNEKKKPRIPKVSEPEETIQVEEMCLDPTSFRQPQQNTSQLLEISSKQLKKEHMARVESFYKREVPKIIVNQPTIIIA
jgi:hypothetical protein